MATRKDIGDALVRAALHPIRKASAQLREGSVGEGLAALAKPELLAALQKGVKEAAARFGLREDEVSALLPWDALKPALDRLEAAQAAATAAFARHAASVGGLLTGLGGGTDVSNVRRQTGAEVIGNFAGRFSRDKQLHEPLAELGAAVGAWEGLISQCGDRLETSPLHARYARRRLVIRVAALGFVAGAIAAGAVVAAQKKQLADARARIEAAIASPDPCAVEGLSARDAALATPEQVKREEERLAICAAERAKARREASCDALAKGFEEGKLSEEDVALAAEAAPRLARAAEGKLGAADLKATPKDMPCQDAAAKGRIWATYARRAAESRAAWAEATEVSDALREALSGKELSSATAYREELSQRAEAAANKAIRSGRPGDMEQGKALCDFQASFGLELGKKCTGLARVLAKKKR